MFDLSGKTVPIVLGVRIITEHTETVHHGVSQRHIVDDLHIVIRIGEGTLLIPIDDCRTENAQEHAC